MASLVRLLFQFIIVIGSLNAFSTTPTTQVHLNELYLNYQLSDKTKNTTPSSNAYQAYLSNKNQLLLNMKAYLEIIARRTCHKSDMSCHYIKKLFQDLSRRVDRYTSTNLIHHPHALYLSFHSSSKRILNDMSSFISVNSKDPDEVSRFFMYVSNVLDQVRSHFTQIYHLDSSFLSKIEAPLVKRQHDASIEAFEILSTSNNLQIELFASNIKLLSELAQESISRSQYIQAVNKADWELKSYLRKNDRQIAQLQEEYIPDHLLQLIYLNVYGDRTFNTEMSQLFETYNYENITDEKIIQILPLAYKIQAYFFWDMKFTHKYLLSPEFSDKLKLEIEISKKRINESTNGLSNGL